MSDFDDPKVQRIGVVLVHGIGEQRRFEHLDWQGRDLIRGIAQQPGVEITVEIGTHASTVFHADSATWDGGGGGAVKVHVRTAGVLTHCLHFHEVWWADVNERYSVAKQLRFWFWGLSIWAYPRGSGEQLHGTSAVTSPSDPVMPGAAAWLWYRLRLFLVGAFFCLAAFPLGLGLVVIQRLFNLKTPNILKTLTNYISGVKLFNQRHRYGPGFGLPPPAEDFLDTVGEPPRVSVRRRVIRTIAEVAQQNYHRWYLVAHSQGTVAAFNGLMETPFAWPGYFDRESWLRFCAAGFGGPGEVPAIALGSMPRRPVWAAPDDVAYRAQVFARCHGFLTLGSPLEKFAAIWPARVPICLIPAFPAAMVWINVFDPIDPVSGVLKAYAGNANVCPPPQNIGYAAYWVLLLAHLKYVTWTGPGCLADGVAHWLLSDDPGRILAGSGRYAAGSARACARAAIAWAWWAGSFIVLSVAAGASVRGLELPPAQPPAATAAVPARALIVRFLSGAWHDLLAALHILFTGGFCWLVLWLLLGAGAVTLGVGLALRLLQFRSGDDPLPAVVSDTMVADPAPEVMRLRIVP